MSEKAQPLLKYFGLFLLLYLALIFVSAAILSLGLPFRQLGILRVFFPLIAAAGVVKYFVNSAKRAPTSMELNKLVLGSFLLHILIYTVRLFIMYKTLGHLLSPGMISNSAVISLMVIEMVVLLVVFFGLWWVYGNYAQRRYAKQKNINLKAFD